MTLLTADIGGTNSRFEVFAREDGELCSLARGQYENRCFASFADALQQFLDEQWAGAITAAAFAVAGPIASHGPTRLTNLAWELDKAALAQRFAIGRVELLNDFAAIAYGAPYLPTEGIITLQAGQAAAQATGVRAFVGAGTGLGHALSISSNKQVQVLASEGGHAGFAPADGLQRRLLDYYAVNDTPVDVEFFLSGRGLVRIHQALCAFDGVSDPLALEIMDEDGPARLGEAALNGEPHAVASVELFWQLYAAHAGDVALQVLPNAGLYLAGGIAPKLLPIMDPHAFLHAFHNKAAMHELLRTIPVFLIRDEGVARLGAAHYLLRD